MNSGPTSERVYDALSRRVREGSFRPGERLDPAGLAETLASSVTPVRDALHRLLGEGLVESRTSEGFHLPQVNEPGLKDLYEWNGQVLLLAIGCWPGPARAGHSPRSGAQAGSPEGDGTSALFLSIAAQSRNAEHLQTMRALNARLCAPRRGELGLFADYEVELAAMASAMEDGALSALRRLISAYHRRRQRAVPEIVRRLYRS